MPDATPVAKRLAGIALTQDSRSCDDQETKINTAARALDDAGVREAVDKLEHLTKHPVDAYVREFAKAALAALAGTKGSV